MPRKAAIQAIFGSPTAWARKRPFSCPPVAMTVRRRPMIAIPVAINLGSAAMISRRSGIVSCNQRAHDPPMIAIPRADDCRSLHVGSALRGWMSCRGLATIRLVIRVPVSAVVSLMVWCLSLRKQRAASCRSARPGCASGKGLRGDPERNEIDGFGHFVFDLGRRAHPCENAR